MASLDPRCHLLTYRAAAKDHGGANRAPSSSHSKKKSPLAGFLGGGGGEDRRWAYQNGLSLFTSCLVFLFQPCEERCPHAELAPMFQFCMVWRENATARVCRHRINRFLMKECWDRRFPHGIK